MPTQPTPAGRRRRADMESDVEADRLRISQRSSPSASDSIKRARTNKHQSRSESPLEGSSRINNASNHQIHGDEDSDDEAGDGEGQYKPGAIVRVKLTNFVTYEDTEFSPGPYLNMVIGPNGTGKSSLVCALCLGLGWGPQCLGRAGKVAEFVKHGMPEAFVEIELQKRESDPKNFIVRCQIIRDGNRREYWLNGKKTSQTAITTLMKELSIQIDNLCQFLPQDKVSEFAALSPTDLLLHTQRAAAGPHMLEWHENLKGLRKSQKRFEEQQQGDQERLANEETRQQNLHAEVQRLQERNQIIKKVGFLRKSIPFIEYAKHVAEHKIHKAKKTAAQNRYKELQERIAPTFQSSEIKKKYKQRIENVVKERKTALSSAENEANKLIADIEALDEEIKKNELTIKAEEISEKKRKDAMNKLRRSIIDMQARLNDPPINFDPAEWNNRIKEKEHKMRDAQNEIDVLENRGRESREKMNSMRTQIEDAKRTLASLDTSEGRQTRKLASLSKDTAIAWDWVKDNLNKFEKEVYAPPLISCAVKDPRYTNAVEAFIGRNDMLCITAQTLNDMKALSNQLHGTMKLADITIRTNDGTKDTRPPISKQDMERYGLDGWAIDYIDGPVPVVGMLAQSARIDRTGVTLRDTSNDLFGTILEEAKLDRWVTSTNTYQVNRRREYGPQAVSTMTKGLKLAQHWTEQPVDDSIKRELEDNVATLENEFDAFKAQVAPLSARYKILRDFLKAEKVVVDNLKKEKGVLQKAHSEHNALPDRINREEDAIEAKRLESADFRKSLDKSANLHDLAVLRKAKKVIEHKDQVAKIRMCHEQLTEAQIRLIEAESDIQGLEDRNKDVTQQRDDELARVQEIEEASKEARARAIKSKKECQEIIADPENEADILRFNQQPEGTTVEDLEAEIAAEESKLEYIHANNPNAIVDFEQRQMAIDKLKEKITETESKLARVARHISRTRERWEPELDTLISKISEEFAYNFEQIGCAGEVSVHKDDDFDLWAIQIKVKFRENETLQILDQHRQSGGERSVSTIFYLMSLQSLAVAPFRVVDEINQGMDPRNERMVHERMVDIACKENTSQYFLITPKLLTGLAYHKKMKVHCIASGEHMPAKYQDLDVRSMLGIQRAVMLAAR